MNAVIVGATKYSVTACSTTIKHHAEPAADLGSEIRTLLATLRALATRLLLTIRALVYSTKIPHSRQQQEAAANSVAAGGVSERRPATPLIDSMVRPDPLRLV